MTDHSENTPDQSGVPAESVPDATAANAASVASGGTAETTPIPEAAPTQALPPQAPPAQALPPQAPPAAAAPAAALPVAPAAVATATPAKPFWSRTGTRIGAGIAGGLVVLMVGFGGGWLSHGELRPGFGMHEQAWGHGDRGPMRGDSGGQNGPRGGQGFGNGQNDGGQRFGDGQNGTNGQNGTDGSNGTNGTVPDPSSTPGS
ncbi:hypothetical protein [Microbacterium sp.]|uniref:hypothetical protein n=1 Tax=Microbacterium sp. TaxID=51671 RepID=UPI003A920118